MILLGINIPDAVVFLAVAVLILLIINWFVSVHSLNIRKHFAQLLEFATPLWHRFKIAAGHLPWSRRSLKVYLEEVGIPISTIFKRIISGLWWLIVAKAAFVLVLLDVFGVVLVLIGSVKSSKANGKGPESVEQAMAMWFGPKSKTKDEAKDRKSTRLNSSHSQQFRMPSSA